MAEQPHIQLKYTQYKTIQHGSNRAYMLNKKAVTTFIILVSVTNNYNLRFICIDLCLSDLTAKKIKSYIIVDFNEWLAV